MERLIDKGGDVSDCLIGTLFSIYYNATDSPRQAMFNAYLLE